MSTTTQSLGLALATILAGVLAASTGRSQPSDGNVPTPTGPVGVDGTGAGAASTPGGAVYVPQSGSRGEVDLNRGLPSSARPTTDTSKSQDGFDFKSKSSPTVRGSGDGGLLSVRTRAPDLHLVRRGDTLWSLSGHYYHSHYEWPRLWSYNPQLLNPHYIHPGDQLRLRPGNGRTQSDDGAGRFSRESLVPKDTVFIRHYGYIGDPEKDRLGVVAGSREDQALLAHINTIYIELEQDREVRIGQTLTIYNPVRRPRTVKGARTPPGYIVSIRGTVKVIDWDKKHRIARAAIIESLAPIERGFMVGPVGRRFDVVPPRRSDKDQEARILDALYPHEVIGQHQVVFIDRGADDGVKVGHRFRVVRRGDAWRRTLTDTSGMAKDRVRDDVPDRVVIEPTPVTSDEQKLPDEVVGELRVLRVQKYSALAVVTEAGREMFVGDRAIATRGY